MRSSLGAPNLIFTIFLSLCFVAISATPQVQRASVISTTGDKAILRLEGLRLTPEISVRTTESRSSCDGKDAVVNGSLKVASCNTIYVTVNKPSTSRLYFCLARTNHERLTTNGLLWMHQRGVHAHFADDDGQPSSEAPKYQASGDGLPAVFYRQRRASEASSGDAINIFGMRIESSGSDFGEDGIVVLLSQSKVNIRLFGENISSRLLLSFTAMRGQGGTNCVYPSPVNFHVLNGTVTNNSALVEVVVPVEHSAGDIYFLCIRNDGDRSDKWIHQGDDPWLQIRVYAKFYPLWASIITIIFLLCCSALFSGLTLGLMSMDKTDLKILCNTGTELEKKYATAIMPVRSHGSLLLCSLLLGNVLVNSVLTILMDDITSGIVAVIFSTLTIVIFGEIMPQAFCSRHGLAVGAKTIYITKFVILLTAIVAYPISKILDFMLGEEIGNVYNRERLNELVKTGTDIEKEEVNIISGALQLSKKTVSSIMTKLEDVFMLDYNSILDYETISEIMNSGYSRIPVYQDRRSNITTLLYIKDLAFVDPDENTPLKTLCDFYQNSLYDVSHDMALDDLLKVFKSGTKGHMALVTLVDDQRDGDPEKEIIGLVTLEDVIEELIQAEIVDETDVWTDNRSKRKREKHAKNKNFSAFAEKRTRKHKAYITPHMTLAAFQYLSTSVDAFRAPAVSENSLRRLLDQNVYRQIRMRSKESILVYEEGKPADYFVLILEGRVEVLVGKESMRFESGPFTYFGLKALLPPNATDFRGATGSVQSVNLEATRQPFIPDYTVQAATDLLYIYISRSTYLSARRATLLSQSMKAGDQFDDEIDKLLHIDDDERSNQGSQSSRKGSHNDRESPTNASRIADLSPANGMLPISKSGSENSDPEERTTLLPSAVS